jgi:hypothetical protein
VQSSGSWFVCACHGHEQAYPSCQCAGGVRPHRRSVWDRMFMCPRRVPSRMSTPCEMKAIAPTFPFNFFHACTGV